MPPLTSSSIIQTCLRLGKVPDSALRDRATGAAYIDRVARVFQNNGSGVRGDMKAVIRAVLTDPEARGAAKWAYAYGHQSEPVLAITPARAMNAQTDGVRFRTTTANSGQTVFISPSVFNYYPPDYSLSKSGTVAPEFAIWQHDLGAQPRERCLRHGIRHHQPRSDGIRCHWNQFDLSPLHLGGRRQQRAA